MMTIKLDSEALPFRVCDVCGGVDQAPRHIHAAGPDELAPPTREIVEAVTKNAAIKKVESYDLMSDLYDRTTQLRHMDCCRELGCPDGTCDSLPTDLKDGKLRTYIVEGK